MKSYQYGNAIIPKFCGYAAQGITKGPTGFVIDLIL